MGRDRAAYMREYRARHRAAKMTGPTYQLDVAIQRVAELEEEVRQLKAELAKRPPAPVLHPNPILAAMGLDVNGNPPGIEFRPVPKPSQRRK